MAALNFVSCRSIRMLSHRATGSSGPFAIPLIANAPEQATNERQVIRGEASKRGTKDVYVA